jgi:hypothetical protein
MTAVGAGIGAGVSGKTGVGVIGSMVSGPATGAGDPFLLPFVGAETGAGTGGAMGKGTGRGGGIRTGAAVPGVTGAGVLGAGVSFGAGVPGAGVLGAFVFGAGVSFGAGVPGAGVLGAGVLGAGVLGAGVVCGGGVGPGVGRTSGTGGITGATGGWTGLSVSTTIDPSPDARKRSKISISRALLSVADNSKLTSLFLLSLSAVFSLFSNSRWRPFHTSLAATFSKMLVRLNKNKIDNFIFRMLGGDVRCQVQNVRPGRILFSFFEDDFVNRQNPTRAGRR